MRIAVVPGDGIGPEIVAQGLRVLEAAASEFDLRIETLNPERYHVVVCENLLGRAVRSAAVAAR